MVTHTNVNAKEFLKDYCRLEDVRQDLNAEAEAARDIMIDRYGEPAYIFAGLTVEDGAGANTFLVRAGRARDNEKYHIVVPANVDNIPCLSNALNTPNYIAVRHIYTYANPDAAVKTGLAYFRQRSDYYEIGLANTAHNEADGWVRLARATNTVGGWVYDMEFTAGNPDYPRSREAEICSYTIDFTFNGVPGNVLMDRHGIPGGPVGAPTGDLWRVPYDVLVCKVSIIVNAPGAANMDINLWQNGAIHANWTPGVDLVLPAGAAYETWYNPSGMAVAGAPVQYHKGDLIQVELAPLGGAPQDIAVLISGRETGTV